MPICVTAGAVAPNLCSLKHALCWWAKVGKGWGLAHFGGCHTEGMNDKKNPYVGMLWLYIVLHSHECFSRTESLIFNDFFLVDEQTDLTRTQLGPEVRLQANKDMIWVINVNMLSFFLLLRL